MLTLRQAIDGALSRASLEGGVDTQVYADDALQQLVQHQFNTLFDKWWWPQFYNPGDTSYTLDGTTGLITQDISQKVGRFIDIRYVWYGTCCDPLPRAPLRMNPSQIKTPCVQPYNDPRKVFRLLPMNASDTITIAYRTKPDDFQGENAEIDMDSELMILGVAYDYINSLGLNPGAEDKLSALYADRLQTIMNEMQNMDVSMQPMSGNLPTSWNWV